MVYFGTRQTVTREDDRSRTREFDALYVGTRAVLLNQTKSSPRSEDARAFAEFLRSGEFARYFPQHRELPIVPAFSSLSIPEAMVPYLTRHGIYARRWETRRCMSQRDRYQLISLLHADGKAAGVAEFKELSEVNHETEVNRLLIWIATASRQFLDMNERPRDSSNDAICGKYWDAYTGDR